tara:strand:+ start:402 stop:635 length:234 start_codon:yes stop_codon:yes gene_type:complete
MSIFIDLKKLVEDNADLVHLIGDFDRELDATTSGIYIGDRLVPYSRALKKMDPDYYRRAFHSWAENDNTGTIKEILV